MENSGFVKLGSYLAILFLLACSGLRTTMPDIPAANPGGTWTGSWAAAPQLVVPNKDGPSLANNTLRQIVRVSIGGGVVRLKFSNFFGKTPMVLKSAAIAVSRKDCDIDASKQKTLRFNGSGQVAIEPGAEIVSDPLVFPLERGSRLAVTISFGEVPAEMTGHSGSRTTSYVWEGVQSSSADCAETARIDHWYVISGLEVQGNAAGAIAVLGNSITDGRGSGTNRQNRWTDILSQRLLENPETQRVGVLNLGIGGNCVLHGGLGPTALNRLDRDILAQSHVKWLVILEGINDIGGAKTAEDAREVADGLIAAYEEIIAKAHAKGIKVYGATILPFAKSFYDASFRQKARDKVNDWIRHGGRFDAVIDFDKTMKNPDNPQTILSDMHDNDFLHPNEAGYKRMGDSIDLDLFR